MEIYPSHQHDNVSINSLDVLDLTVTRFLGAVVSLVLS